jgi:predicted nuclease of restriction endonuclease-like RecB superfamily
LIIYDKSISKLCFYKVKILKEFREIICKLLNKKLYNIMNLQSTVYKNYISQVRVEDHYDTISQKIYVLNYGGRLSKIKMY